MKRSLIRAPYKRGAVYLRKILNSLVVRYFLRESCLSADLSNHCLHNSLTHSVCPSSSVCLSGFLLLLTVDQQQLLRTEHVARSIDCTLTAPGDDRSVKHTRLLAGAPSLPCPPACPAMHCMETYSLPSFVTGAAASRSSQATRRAGAAGLLHLCVAGF